MTRRLPKRRPRTVDALIGDVVAADHCTGCGACAAMFENVSMASDDAGFWRPLVEPAEEGTRATRHQARSFRAACPGVGVTAPRVRGPVPIHPVFGAYRSVWEAWAADPAVREAGSSGGVLTALAQFIAGTTGGSVLGVTERDGSPPGLDATWLATPEELLATAGSRYAPVGVAERAWERADRSAVVGKPCEVAAIRGRNAAEDRADPLLLTFFCAGTPSVHATRELLDRLAVEPSEVTQIRYRGDGWPGRFRVRTRSGDERSMSYEESWGKVLGKQLQWRCKVCPDGTGELGDVSVGDYWETDERGFPLFEDASGRSVVIGRTPAGERLIADAVAAGVIGARPVDPDRVAAVQPLQVERRTTLAGRVFGSTMAGRRRLRVRRFRSLRQAIRHPRANLRAARGTFRRVRTVGPRR